MKFKRTSQAHEQRIARAVNGKRTPGSGSLGQPGDVLTEDFLISCKQTDQRSLRLALDDVEQIIQEAEDEQRTPMLALELTALQDEEKDWIAVPLRVWVSIRAKLREPR